MESLHLQIVSIKKDIEKLYTYDYLFDGFEKLIQIIESGRNTPLTTSENFEIMELIQILAKESRYNNYASSNWVRYSARCFFCADALIQYIDKDYRDNQMIFLNDYFLELVNSGVAPIIPDETLDKYIQINIVGKSVCDFYDSLISKAISESSRGRIWSADEMSLRCKYTISFKRLILKYVTSYSDLSLLKKWIPSMNTVGLVKVWYKYPDSGNYGQYTQASVEKSLDNMLDIHLELLSFWYWHNPEEMIDAFSLEYLIEILEVIEDNEFEKILRHAITLPFNEKIKAVLEHFTDDDEYDVVTLSRNLLHDYTKK